MEGSFWRSLTQPAQRPAAKSGESAKSVGSASSARKGGKALDDEDLLRNLVETMAAKIFNGTYAPGQKLRQESLAEEYEVSRTPVREALRQLEIKGLVVQKKRYGATVVAPTTKDIGANYWLRGELEGMATELAVQWISDADLQRLQAVHAECVDAVRALHDAVHAAGGLPCPQAAEPMRNWVAKNQEFHALIYSASGNASLERIIRELHLDYTRNILNMTVLGMYESRMQKNIAHHGAIVQAMLARDSAAARHAMRTHVQESGAFVVDWLQKRPAPPGPRAAR